MFAKTFLFTLFNILPVLEASEFGIGMQCCDLALQKFAYMNKNISHSDYKCGQSYSPDVAPAPVLSVSTKWCQQHCPGFALTPLSSTNTWASPLFSYIFPAVVFSTTTPRRLVLEPSGWFFEFGPHRLDGMIKAIFSLCVAGFIVSFDTIVWILTIMVAPGPFLFSGLVEAVIDYRIIHNLLSCHTPRGADSSQSLSRAERVELLTAVVAGNLATEDVPADPQSEMETFLDISKRPKEVVICLRAMLTCQYSFGAAVGGPILFYIGSFAYTLISFQDSNGDNDSARALAFGIWWMNIVHVAAVGGCLLASNNPSTAAALVANAGTTGPEFEHRGGDVYARKSTELEDRIQAWLEALSRLNSTHRVRYVPVWMWNRGKSKACWLRRTAAWEKDWYREKIEMTGYGWIFLAMTAYFLVLFPCALAFWIEFNTLPRGPGCRSMTVSVYACAQVIFVILSAWSHFKGSRTGDYWDHHKLLNRLRQQWVGIAVAIVFLLPAWLVAVFTTVAGTLMQITGVFQNCICLSTGYWSFPNGSVVTLSTDTEFDRRSSRQWVRAGYTALVFLACVTYLGWWCQRYLREKYIEQVEHLVEDRSPSHVTKNAEPRNDPRISEGDCLRECRKSGSKEDALSV